MEKSIIIIGAGIAGLSAGCYGQMNGYRTRIFEMHTSPGGLCTAWKRRGYTFDGCIHYLVGARPGLSFYRLWEELGAVQGRQMVTHEEASRVLGKDGKTFVLYNDIDRLEQHMKELAPADAKVIEEFAGMSRLFTGFVVPWEKPRGLMTLPELLRTGIKMMPFLRAMGKWSKVSIGEFAARFTDRSLREMFLQMFPVPDGPMISLFLNRAFAQNGDAASPMGGSLEFARAIERRYTGLGGEIHYRSRVDKILVEDGRAIGVRVADSDGSFREYTADVVASAADGHATIFDMLDGRYIDTEIQSIYDERPVWRPWIQVSLGVARSMANEPHALVVPLTEPFTVAGEAVEQLNVRHFCFDPTMAPPGKSVVAVDFESDYGYWKALSEDRGRYKAAKQRVAQEVIARLESLFPGISQQVEVIDVVTPTTYERYTGNWQGSPMGWMFTTKTPGFGTGKGMRKTLPGLERFHMIGQWVEPGGGLPGVAITGRDLIQILCKQDKKPFVTAVP